MRNHLVRRQTRRSQGPVLLNHTLGDDAPLLVGLLPDAPPDHLIPVPANLSAGLEALVAVAAEEGHNVIEDFWRKQIKLGGGHHSFFF